MLPDINGFDVCRRLRTDRDTMLTPVVMLTALGDAANRIQGFRVGANAYVTKPYGIEELFEAIATARAWRAGMEQAQHPGRDPRRAQQRDHVPPGPQRLPDDVCQATPFDDEQVHALRQAVMEMGQNAIEWGNRHQSDRLVNITYRVYEDRVEIVVRDQGRGLRPDQPAPRRAARTTRSRTWTSATSSASAPGGFGLMICKGMVDELRYNDVGNEVTLIKRFRRTGPSRSDRSA